MFSQKFGLVYDIYIKDKIFIYIYNYNKFKKKNWFQVVMMTNLFNTLFNLDKGYINNDILSLNNNKFKEKFDKNKLAYILNNMSIINEVIQRRENARNLPILEKYYLNSKSYKNVGFVDVEYLQLKNDLYGRYQAKNAISGQGMVREVRHTIFEEYYIDLDIVNAHPVILSWLCENLDIDCKYLNEYNQYRNNKMDEIQLLNPNLTKDKIKTIFISIINGGNKDYNNIEKKSKFIINYYKELQEIINSITSKFHLFKNNVDLIRNRDDNLNGATMAHLLQFVENQLLLTIYNYLENKNQDSINNSILCFDGIMVLKKQFKKEYIYDLEEIFNNLGINIKLKIKEMEPINLHSIGYNSSKKYIYEPNAEGNDDSKIDLIDYLIEKSKDKKREFGTGIIYTKIKSYYYMREYDEPEKYLNKIFNTKEYLDLLKEMIYNDKGKLVPKIKDFHKLNKSEYNSLLNFMRNIEHNDFKFININYNFLGFQNGILNLETAEFIKEEDVDTDIIVRKYIDKEFKITETPLLDKYFKYQFDNEVIQYVYFMAGRCLTKIKDKFDVMPLFYGQSRTGKSLILELIKYSFNGNQISNLSKTFQDKFGLAEVSGSQIFACDDMPPNISSVFPKSTFQSIVSNGSVSCPIKGVQKTIEIGNWDIPLIWCSNYLPNYSEDSGEITDRIFLINYENYVPENERDISLLNKIIDLEYSSFIYKAITTFIDIRDKNIGKSIWTFCPQYFIDNKELIRNQSNQFYNYLMTNTKYVENAELSVDELKDKYNTWLKEKYNNSISNIKISFNTLLLANKEYIIKKLNICKYCKNKHRAECCDKYNRTARSSKNYIMNIAIDEYQNINF